ncbi:DNA polymerase III subunit alpha [Limosilactobacillus avium]|uniref:DNA polymerase III subunit alpha n=1 Tax=Limosilactobacillus avium TaxID=2991831 RepID=UPI0024B9C0C5|nr:DNA polymerase III subunit alpha [Limosilactobacillus avium]
MDYVPLQVHSSYSLLNSPIQINDLVQAAKERGYSALALTDENILYGAVEFYNAAKQAGIKPLIGLELTVHLADINQTRLQLTLLAKSQLGYQNLMDISTIHQTRDREQLPLSLATISKYLGDLIVLVPVQVGVFGLLRQGNSWLDEFQEPIAQNNFYLGVNLSLDSVERAALSDFARENSISLVATAPVDYLNPTDLFATKVLQAIGQGAQLKDLADQSKEVGGNFLPPQKQVIADYQRAGLQDAVAETSRIAAQCDVTMQFKSPVLPHFPTPDGERAGKYLRDLCLAGLKKRPVANGFTAADYQRRLDRELKVIHQMGFDDYFLIIWDVMNFAHQAKITTDPGRGSAAGSLVAYALAITEVDPLEYHLLFERFLNPERAQMPDIDLDIPDNRRGEVLQYVHHKYGHQRVAQIITFGTLAAKQVIRDVSRVFGLTQYELTTVMATLPKSLHFSLQQAVAESQRLRNLLTDQPKIKLLFDVAQKLEGLPRHYSTHAAGIVLSEEPLHEIVPLQAGSDGLLMTQFPKDTVEALGLLKMDFLGLRNLSIMDDTIKLIKKRQPNFSLAEVRLDDQATIHLFQRGMTDGVFQFESAGIRNVLVSLHPDCFEDIVAVNALYRPGPMENIAHFIARKHGQEAVKLPDNALQPILGPTYGILVYQEQVMQLASAMAGFTLGEADLLRRAMSKKKKQTMAGMRTKFMAGAEKKGYRQELASQVFDYIDRFANYGFNRSHAVAYSKLAFEMAYLKCHYPAEFYTALMNAEGNVAKLRQHITNAQKMGVKVNGPKINVSQQDFTIKDQEIYFGFSAIKGVRRDFVGDFLEERTQNGPFTDIRNFINRLPSKWQKEELIAPLIYVGAFDGLGYNRAEMIASLPKLLSGIELLGMLGDFAADPSLQSSISRQAEFPLTTRLAKENEYLGVYLSGHPVSQYRDLAQRLNVTPVKAVQPGQPVTLIVFVNRVKTIYTKKDHRQMAFITASDESGLVDITVFPRQYQEYQQLLTKNQVLVITGHGEERPGHGLQVIAKTIRDAKQVRQQFIPHARWVLRINPVKNQPAILKALHQFMAQHRGRVPVLLYYPETDVKMLEPASRWLNTSAATQQGLKQILGPANVVLQQLKH